MCLPYGGQKRLENEAAAAAVAVAAAAAAERGGGGGGGVRVEAVCSFFLSFFSALALSSSVSVACASATTPTLVAACLLMPAWLACLLACRLAYSRLATRSATLALLRSGLLLCMSRLNCVVLSSWRSVAHLQPPLVVRNCVTPPSSLWSSTQWWGDS